MKLKAPPLNPEEKYAVLSRLLRENARQYVPQYILAFLCMAIGAGCTALSAWIMKDIINGIFIEKNAAMLTVISGAVLAIYFTKGMASYIQTVTLSKVGNHIIARNQAQLFDHIASQGIRFFQTYAAGDLVARIARSAQAARMVLQLVITSIGRDIFTLIALVIVMLLQDPVLTLTSLLIGPIAILSVRKIIRRTRNVARGEFQAFTQIINMLHETVGGIRIVKAFTMEDALKARMQASIAEVEEKANKMARLSARTSPIMEGLAGIAIAGIIGYGGYAVIYQGVDAGKFFSFITAFLLAYDPAKRLAKVHVDLEAGLIAVKMMYEILDTPAEEQAEASLPALPLASADVRLEDVSFRYDGQPTLENVTLEAKAGEMIALVGPSGAGKSTVFALLEKFYRPESGRVLLGGLDIRDYSARSVRGHIAYVSQDTFLFAGTVLENIRYGRPDANDEAVMQAARQAHAHEFIERLANGYHTPLTEGGTTLSGGQRQRIAIARAFLKNAPILLLDEATSALDSESEMHIQQALQELMRGKTTLVIAHRLSTVQKADRIYVMDKGKTLQNGNHSALILQGGLYEKLYSLQLRDE